LDQTELADIDYCDFEANITAAVWLTNGSDRTAGANGGFTNRIAFRGCQFNGTAAWGVIDDGGYNHTYSDCNFNGFTSHIRTAGGVSINVQTCEMEGATGPNIVAAYTTAKSGTGVGSTIGLKLDSNTISPSAGNTCLNIVSLTSLTSINNRYGNTTAAKITGSALCGFLSSVGDTSGGGGAIIDGSATSQFSTSEQGTFLPVLNLGGSVTGITYLIQSGEYTKWGNCVNFRITLALASKGAASGVATISGLPYPGGPFTQALPPPFATGIITSTSVGAWITAGSSSILLQNSNTNFSSALLDTNLSNTSYLIFNGCYFVR